MDLMTSERNKTLFIVDGHKFRFHKTLKNDIQRWTCYLNYCKCYLKLNDNNSIIFNSDNHNHQKPHEETLNRLQFNNTLKRKAILDISTKPSKLIHTEIRTNNLPPLTLSDVTLIRRNIRNSRNSIHPRLPKSSLETQNSLNNMEILTNTGEPFMIINDIHTSIIIFSTVTNLKTLCDTDNIYVDGTFKSCPKFFHQIFTIHGYVNNKVYIPLVFGILGNKELGTYIQFFKHIVTYCSTIDLTFLPNRIFIDFEIGIHNAAIHVWPLIEIKGDQKSEQSKFLRVFFGLPFLSPNDIDQCFVDDIMAIQPTGDKIQAFLDYVFETYIDPSGLFPPDVWAEFKATTNRTTNVCESFHSRLNGMFNCSHPNIYNFIDVLKDIQIDTYIKIRSKEVIKMKKTTVEKNFFLRQEMLKYENKKIS
ncbi:hypothetical protein AGLY_001593 [Aphis glycines]|uniref:FLYWCH-type domain-containing protein n=1 Tax=Aphis glycines TaxID=307491 RepID=A0A6G0U5R3_APHGL|nr:hypothetical protein AGLY_001593 [Aphis glycines]